MASAEPPVLNRNSRSRVWERNRRNKFNDAINKLGDIVQGIIKENVFISKELDSSKDKTTVIQDIICENIRADKDTSIMLPKDLTSADKKLDSGKDNLKYPKIEILHRAILCLNFYAREMTQLKAEILALQVKLEAHSSKLIKKDASTQAQVEIRRGRISRSKKILINIPKAKCEIDVNDVPAKPKPLNESNIQSNLRPKTSNILPQINVLDKKAHENAIVVLPPYIFPQRPLLFPSAPPAFVVLDPNLHLTKSVPIVSRHNNDITKTTMVNILPISAFSCPISCYKNKKNSVKIKNESVRKNIKKNKSNTKDIKESVNSSEPSKTKSELTIISTDNVAKINTNGQSNLETSTVTKLKSPDKSAANKSTTSTESIINNTKITVKVNSNENYINNKNEVNREIEKRTCSVSNNSLKTISETVTAISNTNRDETNNDMEKIKSSNEFTKSDKIVLDKNNVSEAKEKEHKLTNILETSLCDNVVDGGNARLELAEEFLAASPTAAFLMSFPLVSGNRADSPADEPQNSTQSHSKESNHKHNDVISQQAPTTTAVFFEKPSSVETKGKTATSKVIQPQSEIKAQNDLLKNINVIPRVIETKMTNVGNTGSISNENPFLNIPMPSLISTGCTLSDNTFGLDFDCTLNKPVTTTSYSSNSNIFYKNDPFSTVKSTIYSTSSMSSNHEFNGLGLYPCAMEKYTSKNKSDYANIDDNNLMKMGSSRLTYDIDLGWSHKGFDFVNCTTSNVPYSKDGILTTVTAAPFCTSYNPFNAEFHVPLVSTTNKKDGVSIKNSSSFADTITSFYSQPITNFWSEEPFYTNSNISKTLPSKHQTYVPIENTQTNLKQQSYAALENTQNPKRQDYATIENTQNSKHQGYATIENTQNAKIQTYASHENNQSNSNLKPNNAKLFDHKESVSNINSDNKTTNHTISQQINEKYTKKSPSKMHINWMTSEIRPMQNNCNTSHSELKEPHRTSYHHSLDNVPKRNDNNESYFPLSMHNFAAQPTQDDFQVWPSARPLGPTEISIDPPPINLPTLIGDLALGPHEKKKNLDSAAKVLPQHDLQNCSNFFSVTQLMNRSNDNPTRYQPPNAETSKFPAKLHSTNYSQDVNRKAISSRVDGNSQQPYIFIDPKLSQSYEPMVQIPQNKSKASNKPEKNSKPQKINYSAEALLRGGNFTQKLSDNSSKFLMPSQKYGDYNAPQDTSVAQVSHFPPILDYSDNSYSSQQISGTSLYNTTTNTISNSLYSNFMSGSSNLMSSTYTTAPFTTEFLDYNQSSECNYTNHKYDELKMRNNPIFHNEKVPPPNYKNSRRESATKHKLDCSKKESSKKYQSKRAKVINETEEWSNEPGHSFWQNKASSKKHSNSTSEELAFPNYVSNQMPTQYQPDFLNNHFMPSNMQSVGHNVDRSVASIPITSRANFNLSTIFPEITMKVQ